MNILHMSILLLIGLAGAGVVLTRDPLLQSMVAGMYGILLALFFLILQAPDVALSEIVIGSVAFPLMVVLAITKTRGKGAE